jgi:hypothetical protein
VGAEFSDLLPMWRQVSTSPPSPCEFLGRKEDPLLVGIIGPHYSWGIYKYRHLDLLVGKTRILDSNMWSRRTWTREWLRWWGPATILNDRPILSWERMLHKAYFRMCSVKKILVWRSKGAWRQNELIGNKQPVVKQLWLWPSSFVECRVCATRLGHKQIILKPVTRKRLVRSETLLLLQLIVIMFRKWSINPVIHNPTESHLYTCDNIKVKIPLNMFLDTLEYVWRLLTLPLFGLQFLGMGQDL